MYSIIVKFDIEGSHCWPEAPDDYKLLRNVHSHNFRFEAEIPVLHSHRALEILEVRRVLRDALVWYFGDGIPCAEPCDFRYNSCEQLAEWLTKAVFDKYGLHPIRVVVMEDEFVGAAYTPHDIVQ